MKLIITLLDSGIKKKTSKEISALDNEIIALETIFVSFLKNNPHFKNVKQTNLTLTLCGKSKIRSLNKTYRNKDKATDVLSFPVHENLRPDNYKVRRDKNFLQNLDLGDLIICKDVAKSQAREFKITYGQEIIHLAVHGFLHLLGFDHEISPKEELIMEKLESQLVLKVYKKIKAKSI